MATAQSSAEIQQIIPVGTRNGLRLAIKRSSSLTVGKIVTRVDASDLIAGVRVVPLQVFPDARGFFAELARLGSAGIAQGFAGDKNSRVQVSITLAYPGTIKAIHYHYEQADLWAPISGMLQVFLYDLRVESRTFGEINTLYVGVLRPWEILIPPGVAHGYKVLGTEAAQLVYLTNRFYNPSDEGRLPYDHPEIGYEWRTQHK